MSIEVKIQKLFPDAKIPTYGSLNAAGADLYVYADAPVVIKPHETVLIHTGLAMEIPEGYGGFIFARSGLAAKKGLAPANKVGVVDADYRGEIMVALHNASEAEAKLEPFDRVAQMVFLPYAAAAFIESELSNTERGEGGFGSTGRGGRDVNTRR